MTLYPDRIDFHESQCQVTVVEQLENAAWRLDTTCSGEGETWDDVFVVALVDVSGSERIQVLQEDGTAWTLAPC